MLFSLFSGIRWQDIVDISLNSYILFRLYVLFRGTNVFRVITGIALLWFFQRISMSLGLIVTSWVMQGITTVAALIIVIVFRNEIRNVLQAKNLKAFLWDFSAKSVNTPVEIMVESVYELTQKHVGALLVFPGKEDLKGVAQNGIPWRGIASKEMILSIFWPDNPVHDGAAIIKDDQIAQVGVILPLSLRTDLPSYYGTRHRAAVGLAEASDALIIAVSEERGAVTVVKGASVMEISDNVELERVLRDHLGFPAQQQDYVRREKFQLGMAALVSVMFIMGVWFSFSRGLESLTTLEIPIEYMNRDPGMEIVETSVNAVNLNLSGSGTLIRSLRPDQVKIKLDLGKAVPGLNTFTITNENISLPPGVLLKRVQPQVLEVVLDVPVKKELPVQVDWVGKLPENLILREVKLDADKIQVIGGARTLADITTIYTEKVTLDSLKRSGTLTATLALSPASLKIAPGYKDKVIIKYTIAERSP